MIETPDAIFLNCIGSYFYAIIKDNSGNSSFNPLLAYLARGRLAFADLSLEHIREKYRDNPWGYQPVVIIDENKQKLEIDTNFFGFLKKEYNIWVNSCDMNGRNDLFEILKSNYRNDIYSICNVDEFYIAESKFYKKLHNKHSVLVKNVFVEDRVLEIIDSEKSKPYYLKLTDLENSVYLSSFKQKVLLSVKTAEFRNTAESYVLLNNNSIRSFDAEYLLGIMADMEFKLSLENPEYYFRGFYFNILSKIIPYSLMLCNVTAGHEPIYKGTMRIFTEWKEISKFMLYKQHKKDWRYKPLSDKLNALLDAHNEWANLASQIYT